MRTQLKLVAGIAVVAVGALFVAPALGGPSLKSLVKKEVTKQLAGKTGPAGTAGAQGAAGAQGTPGTPGTPGGPGTPGAAGTARAFVSVDDNGCAGAPPVACSGLGHVKNVNGVSKQAGNLFCIDVAGINRIDSQTLMLVSVEFGGTDANVNEARAMPAPYSPCPDNNDFTVVTMRAGSDTAVSNVSFSAAIF